MPTTQSKGRWVYQDLPFKHIVPNPSKIVSKMSWPTMRKNCSGDQEKVLKFEAKDWEFAKILRSLEQFIQTVKG